MIRHRFALGPDGALVDALALDPARRREAGSYRCPGCEGALLPVLGPHRARHFRHDPGREAACAPETALHRAAKMAVKEGFEAARAEGQPYPLRLSHRAVCRRLEDLCGVVCRRTVDVAHDLTRWMARAELEARVETPMGDFVADVLLSDEARGRPLLVEVVVTHPCDPAKVASGLRIVEVTVRGEEDVARLREGVDARGRDARTHNLAPHTREEPCRGRCRHEVEVCVLYTSGKVWLGWMPLGRVERMPAWSNVAHFEVLAEEGGKDEEPVWRRPIARIDEVLRRARYRHAVPVRSCLLCAHQGFSRETAWTASDQPPLLCLKTGRPVPHTTAIACPKYEPMASDEALRERRARLGGSWE